MLTAIYNLLRRVRRTDVRDDSTSRRPVTESLESRQLMAATVGPVVAQQFVGTPAAITSVVLTFNVPLDPVTAQNADSYRMVRKFRDGNDTFFIGDGKNTTSSSRIRVDSATYDPAANTVTLVPKNSFELRRNFTVLLVKGKGQFAVKTADGMNLDGDGNGKPGGDVALRYKSSARNRLTFKEADGDRVTVKLNGPGRIFYFLPIRGRSSPSIFLRDTNAASSILTGTVRQGKAGDGIADVAQITGAATAQLPIQSDPAFRIRAVT